MAYDVQITAAAEQDLDEIIRYVLNDLRNPQAAQHILNEVEKARLSLAETPEMYAKCRQPLLGRFRKVTFMRYLMIFRIEEDTVYVERFFSELEDYSEKL